jgi:hypothetical protein
MKSQSTQGITDFDPLRDIPSLAGKVLFVTGGTSFPFPHLIVFRLTTFKAPSASELNQSRLLLHTSLTISTSLGAMFLPQTPLLPTSNHCTLKWG